MVAALIPFRTLHYSIPQTLLIRIFRIVVDNEISFFIEGLSEDDQLLFMTVSINLTKGYQRNAVAEIEILLASNNISTN